MANRGQKRTEVLETVIADKRACSSLEFRPSSSNSSNQTAMSSAQDAEMEESSYTSTSTPSDGDGEKEPTHGSWESGNSSHDYYNRYHSSREQSKFEKLMSSLSEQEGESGQLALLTELCELLSFCDDASLSSSTIDSISPILVTLAKHESNPDIMLLALRAVTYLCDINPRSSSFLVRHDVVPVLCQRLTSIEYLDVAEQCLQALEKISREHPLACLQSGVIMAVLMFIDFFSINTQRVALSTLVNICKKLSSESSSHFMDAVPILCNILQHEDREIVESASTCLIKIVEQLCRSSDMLDEICKHGLVEHVKNLIGFDARSALSPKTSNDLIELLAKLAACSITAFKTLLQLNISSTVKDILCAHDPSHGTLFTVPVDGQKNQMHEVLKLLNALLPPITSELDGGPKSEKEAFLLDHPEITKKLGIDILPGLVQVVNSGANMLTYSGCLSVINRLIHFSASDSLRNLLQSTEFPSFLAGAFARKDRHVILLALHIVDATLYKLRHVYLDSFIKEGILFAMHALLSTDEDMKLSPLYIAMQMESDPPLGHANPSNFRCPCFAFDPGQTSKSQEMKTCEVQKERAQDLAKHILTAYFELDSMNPKEEGTTVIQKLRFLSDSLISQVEKSLEAGASSENEEETLVLLQQIISLLSNKNSVSTFEFLESGVVKALMIYLSNGKNLSEMENKDGIDPVRIVEKQCEEFGRLLLSFADSAVPEKFPLLTLIRRLQSALSFLENFPLISGIVPKQRNSYALVPHGCCNPYPSLRVQFIREGGEVSLRNYEEGIVSVDPFVPLNDIEEYLWTRVSNDKGKNVPRVSEVPEVQVDSRTSKPMSADESTKMQVEDLSVQDGKQKSVFQPARKSTESVYATDMQTDSRELNSAQTEGSLGVDSPECSSAEDSSEKLLLYLEGKKLNGNLTLYQSIIGQQTEKELYYVGNSRLWTHVYKVVYKRGKMVNRRYARHIYNGATSSSCPRAASFVQDALFSSGLFLFSFDFWDMGPTCDNLFLLKILEGINRYGFRLMSRETASAFSEGRTNLVSEDEFVNKKLTEKLKQLLCDPMTISAGAMPAWCTKLMTWFPFLFVFEARRNYFNLAALHRLPFSVHSMSSGHAGGVNERQQFHNIPRRKFVVNRSKVLDSAARMMELYARRKVLFEVEYDEEVGTGLGPTLEFYTLVCQVFQKGGLCMWRGDLLSHQSSTVEQAQNSEAWPPPFGLFPRPWSLSLSTSSSTVFSEVVNNFKLLGQMVAKALEDGRVLDLAFSKAFYKLILGKELTVHDVLSFDPALGKVLLELLDVVRMNRYSVCDGKSQCADLDSLRAQVDDLCLDFSLPGYPDYHLVDEIDSKMVNLDNLERYISLVVDATTSSGIARQIEAFKTGFNQVFPIRHLEVFREEELERLLCGEHELWNSDNLLDHINFDHGYTISSPPIIMLLEILREFDLQQQRSFLQFVTGAPRLPTGGLASLNPKLTVVRKHCSQGTDAELPSVMTCANYLKLPPYSSKDVMREKFLYAITEGQGSFHLS